MFSCSQHRSIASSLETARLPALWFSVSAFERGFVGLGLDMALFVSFVGGGKEVALVKAWLGV